MTATWWIQTTVLPIIVANININFVINKADHRQRSPLGKSLVPNIRDIRMVAMAANESVEDAAGKLLNVMSKGDTTYRSARLAAKSCLLSKCNGALDCLRSLVAIERANLEDRARGLNVLEAAVDAIEVRRDINCYNTADKDTPGGRSTSGEDDDGGIAAALAVLNNHCDVTQRSTDNKKYGNIEQPCHFEGWGEDATCDDDTDADDIQPEIFGDVMKLLFEDPSEGTGIPSVGRLKNTHSGEGSQTCDILDVGSGSAPHLHHSSNEEMLNIAINAPQAFRISILYELNETEIMGGANCDALCCIFNSFLSGCGRESIDVSNTKMLMILSQTFYMVGQVDGNVSNECSTTKERQSRIYVKSNITITIFGRMTIMPQS